MSPKQRPRRPKKDKPVKSSPPPAGTSKKEPAPENEPEDPCSRAGTGW